MSAFIVFEGIDGAGKTTQARALRDRCQRRAVPIRLVREPGTTPVGEKIRQIILSQRFGLSARAELLLLAAARAQLVEQKVRPNLAQGVTVVADRFAPSTWAYQGSGRGLSEELLACAESLATGGLQPDLILLLDLPVETALQRKGSLLDRIESEGILFLKSVRERYRALAAAAPERWRVLDGTLPARVLARQVWDAVAPYLHSPVSARR